MKLSILGLAVLFVAGPIVAVADDLDDSFQSLKEAQSKQDVALIKKLAAETSALARQQIAMQVPADPQEKEAWVKRVAYAREVDKFTEYALFSASVSAPPATAIDLLATLVQQNPKSGYLDEGGYTRYFQALEQSGESAKIPDVAEKALTGLPDCEDALMVLANTAWGKGQTGQAVGYAQRMVAAASKHTKPDTNMSQADFERRRANSLGRGYWMIGMASAAGNQFLQADRNLRAALPYISGNDAMAGPALFALGVANYQLGVQTRSKKRVLEAASFSDKAAAIRWAQAQQAANNAVAMRKAAATMP